MPKEINGIRPKPKDRLLIGKLLRGPAKAPSRRPKGIGVTVAELELVQYETSARGKPAAKGKG